MEQGKPNAFPLGRAVVRLTDEAVKDVGKSEGYAVTAWIAVQTLPHLKRGKLPIGVSSRKRGQTTLTWESR